MLRIPSIQHYCNRWCERCSLRQWCAYYQAKHLGEEVSAEEWIENLGDSEARHEFQDLDLEAINELPNILREKEERGPFNPGLSKTLKHYDKWQRLYAEVLKVLDLWWEEGGQEQGAFMSSIINQRQVNAREVLLHYRNFVGPKLQRALGGRFDAGGVVPEQSDWNGSAKVVYLALSHIIVVLPDLIHFDQGSRILIEQLEQSSRYLKAAILMDFPNLMDFQRPGFDVLGEDRI